MTVGAAEQRRRRPWSRLRDMSIWSKLGVIMIVPTLATVIVGTNGLIGHFDTANRAGRAGTLAELSTAAGELIHHLQDERAAAVMMLGAAADPEDLEGAYADAQRRVDDSIEPYQTRRSSLSDMPGSFRLLLDDVGSRLSELPQLRTEVVAEGLGLTDAIASYTELINSLVNIRDSVAQFAGDAELGDRMRAAAGISRAKEFLSQQRVVGHEVLIRDAFAPQLRTAFIGTLTGQEQALETFDAVANDHERALLDELLAGPDVRQSTLYRDDLESLEGEHLGSLPWDAGEWDAVMSAHAGLLRALEHELDEGVIAQAVEVRDAATGRLFVETGVLLVTLLLAILLAWLVARSMARSLRDLRQGALHVAQHGLPQAVAKLRDPAISPHLSSEELAARIAEPLPVRSRDEFGQVTEAFNAVHLEAVRTAAEQAQLRSSVSTMFVNLARRSQILVDRLIGHLDHLERGEEDPDRLAELFQLDHLATRMRRNDENLLVLAGADSSRVQRDPAGLMDVLRAAQSEVEHYTRIEFGVIDRDIEVAAHAVNDLVHLIAELFDNATVFSPPDSQVLVEARRVGDRAVVYVEDRGLGMSPEQLAEVNERLAAPPEVDVTVSRMMGLVVVSRLAARHGVKVELRPAAQRGTIADVTLPTSVLVPRALSGRLGSAAPSSRPGYTSPPPSSLPPQRPTALALESGRSSTPPEGQQPSPALLDAGPFATPAPSDQPGSRADSRALPAWSDLTGAAASGRNGSDRSTPGSPPWPAPTTWPTAAPGSPSPGATPPSPSLASPPPPPAPAPAPAPPPPASASPPLPQRRPGESRITAATGGGGDQTAIPRQRPTEPDSFPGFGSDAATAPHPQVPPPSARPAAPAPPASPAEVPRPSAPPVWPPVAPASPTNGGPAESASESAATAAPKPYTPPQPPPVPVADQTMELPIFNELESVWFRSRRRASEPSAEPTASPAGADATTGDGEKEQPAAVTAASTTTGNTAMGDNAPATTSSDAPTPVSTGQVDGAARDTGWRTAADEGWQAASSLADVQVTEVTQAGLPKRRPMAQLVPGGVADKGAAPSGAQRRTPEAVRGLLSAYHRGVQRGRKQHTDGGGGNLPPATGGQGA